MDSLAASTAASRVAAAAFPTEWITSGVVSPVAGSPAATTGTAWVPHPAVAASSPGPGGSLLDAIASTILGHDPTAAAAAAVQGAAWQQQPAPATAVVAPPAAAPPVAHAGPVTESAPAAQGAPATETAPVTHGAPATESRPATQTQPATETLPATSSSVAAAIAGFSSATGRAVGAVGDAAGAGVSRARRAGSELWAGVRSPRSIHISQVPSKFNAAPAAGNRDCGPASVAMTLRLLGKNIPGIGEHAGPQRLINRVRQLAGNVSNAASTTNHELGRALRAAGTKTREIADAATIRRSVLAGKPVILNGNPRNPGAYGSTFPASQMTPYDGAHWIVVSGFDTKSGKFIINDPLSKVGAVKVSPAQLEAYRAGSMGIEVAA